MANFPIKSFDEGLLVSLGEGDWEQLQAELLAQIDEKSTFFANGKLGIDVGDRALRVTEITSVRNDLFDRQVKLFAVLSTSKMTEDNASSLGLKTRSSILEESDSKLGTAIMDGEPGLFIRKTLRSGNRIEYSGHVVVFGDVNPGAEINCTGSVIIWGKLRGSVHAGMEGSNGEVICAMTFDPVKVRIADISFKGNKLIRKLKRKPVKISIDENGEPAIEYWEI